MTEHTAYPYDHDDDGEQPGGDVVPLNRARCAPRSPDPGAAGEVPDVLGDLEPVPAPRRAPDTAASTTASTIPGPTSHDDATDEHDRDPNDGDQDDDDPDGDPDGGDEHHDRESLGVEARAAGAPVDPADGPDTAPWRRARARAAAAPAAFTSWASCA